MNKALYANLFNNYYNIINILSKKKFELKKSIILKRFLKVLEIKKE